MNQGQICFPIRLWFIWITLLLNVAQAGVPGTLDRSFNPLGISIDSSGNPTAIGLSSASYSGSFIIDLGANESKNSIAIYPNGNFVVASDSDGTRDLGVLMIKPDGTLDRSFNPSGLSINAAGNAVVGGFSGALLFTGGTFKRNTSLAIDHNGRIIVATVASPGPGSFDNLGIIVINSNGTLDRSFNPSGLSIEQSGVPVSGGYSGVLRVDLGRSTFDLSVAVASDNKIVAAAETNTGPGDGAIGVVVVEPNGILDRSFNPSGLSIDQSGNATAIGGYSGSLLVAIDNGAVRPGVNVRQSNNKIYVSCRIGPPAPLQVGIIAIDPDGTLDRTFNPSGVSISESGNPVVAGAYSGILVINLMAGDTPTSTIDQVQGVIYVATPARTGPGVFPENVAVAAVFPDGTLDRSFNPLGLSIDSSGSPVSVGGYSGSLIVNVGEDIATKAAIDLDQGSNILYIASETFSPKKMVVTAISTEGVLDRSFNSLGLSIDNFGNPVAIGGYSGVLIIEWGSDFSPAIAVNQLSRKVYVTADNSRGPGVFENIDILAINGRMVVPPTPPAVGSASLDLPFVLMAAA